MNRRDVLFYLVCERRCDAVIRQRRRRDRDLQSWLIEIISWPTFVLLSPALCLECDNGMASTLRGQIDLWPFKVMVKGHLPITDRLKYLVHMRRHKGSKFQQTVVLCISCIGFVELRNLKVVKPTGSYWGDLWRRMCRLTSHSRRHR